MAKREPVTEQSKVHVLAARLQVQKDLFSHILYNIKFSFTTTTTTWLKESLLYRAVQGVHVFAVRLQVQK